MLKAICNRLRNAINSNQVLSNEISETIDEIKNEIMTGVMEATTFEMPPLSGARQSEYDELVSRDDLRHEQFIESNTITPDEETEIICFEVDHNKEIERYVDQCEKYDIGTENFDKFCKAYEAFKNYCFSFGRIGELYFRANYENYKKSVENRIEESRFWETLSYRVDEFIRSHSPVLQPDIWAAFPKGTSAVKLHIKDLESKGKIAKEKLGRSFLIKWTGT